MRIAGTHNPVECDVRRCARSLEWTIIHRPSTAMGEGETRLAAFRAMVSSAVFRQWARTRTNAPFLGLHIIDASPIEIYAAVDDPVDWLDGDGKIPPVLAPKVTP